MYGYNYILEAVARGVRVINWSWGYCEENGLFDEIDDELTENLNLIATDIIDIAFEHRTTVIATAGNGINTACEGGPALYGSTIQPMSGGSNSDVEGLSYNGYRYPASFDNAISVSGVTNDGYFIGEDKYVENYMDQWTSLSHNDKVDIVAPAYGIGGVHIEDNKGSCHTGTSFAAPIVAGTVGLLLSENPCLHPTDIKFLLQEYSDKSIENLVHPNSGVSNIEYYNIAGYNNSENIGKIGMLDAHATVQAATNYASTGWQSYTLTNGENLWEDISVRYVAGDIVVSDGQTLIIRNSTLMMQSGTAIIVEKGGRLFIDNGKITNGCVGQNWEGIIVEGEDVNQPLPDVYLNSYVSNHGVVILENAIIQNAKMGIYGKAEGYNSGIGIIHATNTEFLNNGTGILLEFFYRNQHSVIRDCIFDGNGHGIGLLGNGLTTEYVTNNLIIEGNLFKDSGLAGRTVGITVWSSSGDIGSFTNANSQNTFEDLYKGIDVYSLLNPRMTVNIYNNEFTNVEKGITLNTTAFNIVEGNRFLNIPVAASSNTDDATYGVQALQAFGLDLIENVFEAADNADNTFGLILGETALYSPDGTMNETNIFNNTFRGPFQSATQIEGDNRRLDFFCNNYAEVEGIDWEFIDDAQLDAQGLPNADGAFTNTWNISADNIHRHIEANEILTGTQIILIPDIPTEAGLIEDKIVGNVDYSMVFQGDAFCPDSPEMPPPNPPGGGGYEICWEQAAQEANDLKGLVHKKKYELVKEELVCKDKVWSDKLLVAVFAGEKDFLQARERLEKVPQDSEPNQEFYQVYDAILTVLENGSTSGKSQSARNLLYSIANPIGKKGNEARNETTILAQSALAMLYGEEYNRGIAEKNIEDEFESLNNSQNILQVFPNPAQNYIKLEGDKIEEGILNIFDQQGQLVLKTEIENTNWIDISNLQNGIYFINYQTDSIITDTQKMIILR